jgi:hypothetical protein
MLILYFQAGMSLSLTVSLTAKQAGLLPVMVTTTGPC